MIQVYTGEGKGKTTAALGLALRMLGHGEKVYLIQFMKGRISGEFLFCRNHPDLTIQLCGRDKFIKRGAPSEDDLQMALEGFKLARQVIAAGLHRLVILDEINTVLDYDLLSLPDVLKVLSERPKHVEIICTGRYSPPELVELANLVTEMREVKHYYRAGIGEREGIEF